MEVINFPAPRAAVKFSSPVVQRARACLKIHSYNFPPHFTPDYMLHFVNVAHYTSQIQHKI